MNEGDYIRTPSFNGFVMTFRDGVQFVARGGIVVTSWEQAARAAHDGWRIVGALPDGRIIVRSGI